MGKTERSKWAGAHESKRGQRTSFNGAVAKGDMAGAAARCAVERARCSGGRRGDSRICAANMASARIAASGYSLPETIAIEAAGSIFVVSGTRYQLTS